MAALAQHVTALSFGASSAFVSLPPLNNWSPERRQTFQHEAVARAYLTNRPSVQAEYDADEAIEFSPLPLVAVRTVRVRYRDIGALPPMSLEDEVDTED